MSVDTAIRPDALSDAAEAKRRLAVDYQSTFASPEGQRVFQDLLNRVLYGNKVLPRLHPHAEMSANDAMYMLSRKDAATEIRELMNLQFQDDPRPEIRRTNTKSRFSNHN